MILSRAPLTEQAPRVRLACIRHAASVRPEPGSNSSCGVEVVAVRPTARHQACRTRLKNERRHDSVVKVQWWGRQAADERKNQGSAAVKRTDTWRRHWPHGQRVSREKEEPENRVVASTPVKG